MKKSELKAKLTKTSSKVLWRKAFNGTLSVKEAKIAADIIERRFPTPERN